MKALGTFDIVYSWGVLHHTGHMWDAIYQATLKCHENSDFFISIYNNQGWKSKFWTQIKKNCSKNRVLLYAVSFIYIMLFFPLTMIKSVLSGHHPFYYVTSYKKKRGMNFYHDVFDWIGGYPFEVATADVLFDFCYEKGFDLTYLRTTQRLGTHQLVFKKSR
jgi:2-polyprenyl-6-hydroxyphenyl methylase/3-demethylubiquinone-9 3-methyltransferase